MPILVVFIVSLLFAVVLVILMVLNVLALMQRLKNTTAPPERIPTAWILSVVALFSGPCALLLSPIALLLGLFELPRESKAKSQLIRLAVANSAAVLLMAGFYVWWTLFYYE